MDASRRPRAIIGGTVPALVGALALSACGVTDVWRGSADEEKLVGSVRVDGSSTVAPLSKAAAQFYGYKQPDVRVTVETSGTGGGFKKFCSGATDVADASRVIKDTEKAACEENDVKYDELAVANDALTVVVNKNVHWVDCLSTAQLKKIWEPGSEIDSWQQVDPKYPDVPLKLFGPDTESGTFDYFTEAVNGKAGASRTDYRDAVDDNETARGVAENRGGMGYFGFSYSEENESSVKSLMIDSGDGCVVPSASSVQDGTYKPLSRPLFIYPAAKALKRPEVEDFVEYFVGHHAQIAASTRFIPLSSEQEDKLKSDLKKLKAAAG
ncbi:PstS family phosphate ABC transporter substrate-binding protein [Streptomyces sp. 891-h]|uniref:PstS family phosphate ABC transporter substrate-binding protein n=1 Tax=unclassified Streptomyces TaxID=2593676 RepID=UPI001FAAE018|nr:PstS family phosphate ABC transporter substrate-binding protein [Streptomyces sp. 891-h]UNZ19893.1 PstS family phosphate ABC transporter substrate-binding protein [Streptomyces sp. 891-h]